MTIRQILRTLRERDSDTLYKSVTDKDTGRKMIASKPDFHRVPYDALKDYWAFVAWADTAVKDLHMEDANGR